MLFTEIADVSRKGKGIVIFKFVKSDELLCVNNKILEINYSRMNIEGLFISEKKRDWNH